MISRVKIIFFDFRESLNDLLQKELNNEISELQKLQEKSRIW